ncbi:MAG: RtcB family protein [Clostridia bacterium]|nr:RtcB family protein [Clostridia bacterium]
MIELNGNRNTAKIFADKIDHPTKTQIASLLRDPAYADSKIRIMPDTHAGRNVAVGTTITLAGRVSPALVGVDIGCGMEVVFLNDTEADLETLDRFIHQNIPCGTKIHDSPHKAFDLSSLCCHTKIDKTHAQRSLGTLGGGNHFIEIDRQTDGTLVLVIHSGSRRLGSDVAEFYQDLAYREAHKKASKKAKQLRREYLDENYNSRALRREKQRDTNIRRENAILEGAFFEQYLHDLAIVTAYADANRRMMADRITQAMGFSVKNRFSCIHNYIDTESMILRKGAISARRGEHVIIPLNMRDGAILATGLGNPDWNFSAPHGAGRICNRTEAGYRFSVAEFRQEMAGIYTTTATEASIDECPMVYKDPKIILKAITSTVTIDEIIRPIYNFKAT